MRGAEAVGMSPPEAWSNDDAPGCGRTVRPKHGRSGA